MIYLPPNWFKGCRQDRSVPAKPQKDCTPNWHAQNYRHGSEK